ncbi:hypothetical protein [Streptomyces albipurpureus]|uniref:Uncharacterized protein n=1 Tax=Streptomyces albipurpureus TaxID=2897419 RepID=A0ABT0UNG6_9ACTN|nr:hypothetical protein [Streptomyces sp. CWNU-1]MCM2389155.1 hypothetical protein [Streptomyces sp. CWNU-1]
MDDRIAVEGSAGAEERPIAAEIGDVVRDIRKKGRVGRVMGRVGPHYQLRPLNGGVEWEAPAEDLAPAEQSDAMRADVIKANADSRTGL